MVGKRRRLCSARTCLRTDESDLVEGGAFSGTGVERPLGEQVSARGEEGGQGAVKPSHSAGRVQVADSLVQRAIGVARRHAREMRQLHVLGLPRPRPQHVVVIDAIGHPVGGGAHVEGRDEGRCPFFVESGSRASPVAVAAQGAGHSLA